MADLDTRDNAAVRNHVPLIPGYKAVAQQLQYVIAQASAWRAYQLPNPSTALAQDADIREVVLRDATVRQADDIHRRATAGRTWAVVPQSEEWDEQWLAQIIERDLRNIKGFTEARYELAGAVLVGDAYAYIEYDEVYRWGSRWCIPRRLVDLDWRTIRYVPRDGIAVRQWSYEVAEDGRLVPSSVFTDVPEDWPLISIVYNDSASRLKRGRGLIDALAPSVWRKVNLFQSLLDAVEAHGSGYLIAAIDSLRSGSSDAKSEEVVAWLEVLQRMRASHIVAHDKDDEVRIESPQGGGIDAILSAIRYEDDQIRSLLLGSSLPFGGGSDGGGSLARSQEEKDTHESRIEYDRAKIDDDLSEQLIGWYLRVNRRALREYGLPAEVVPPRFESGVGPRETFAEIVEAAKGMTELGAPISLADLYERSPFSQPVDGEPTTEAKQPQAQPSPWGGGFRARTGERFSSAPDKPDEMAGVQREVTAALAELIDGLPEDVQEPLIYTALGILDSGETDDATEAIEAALLLIDDGQFAASKWDESKHPRDGGKFAPKEGAGGDDGGDTQTETATDTPAGGDAAEGKPKARRALRDRASAAMRGLSDKVKAARAAVKSKGLVGASKAAAGQAYGTAKKTAAGIARDLEGAGYSPRMARGIAGLAAAVIVSPVGFSALAGGALGMPALAMVPGVVEAGVIVKGAKGAAGMYKRGKKAAGAAVAKVRGKRKGGDPGKAGKQGDSKKEPPA